jgi:hypothetical protein
MIHESDYNLFVVFEMILDKFVELALFDLVLLLLLLFLAKKTATSWMISFCSFALDLTF